MEIDRAVWTERDAIVGESDLVRPARGLHFLGRDHLQDGAVDADEEDSAFGAGEAVPIGAAQHERAFAEQHVGVVQIGSASCRERVCQYVWSSVVGVALKKKTRMSKTRCSPYNQTNIK